MAATTCIHVRYHESQVCEVMTEPSVEAPLPTMMLVHDIRDIPSRLISSGWARLCNDTGSTAHKTMILRIDFIL